MLNDYYNAVRKLLDRLYAKLDEVAQHQYLVIPGASQLCADLELALYHDVVGISDDTIIKEKIKQCEVLHNRLDKQADQIQLILEILSPFNIHLLSSEILPDFAIYEQKSSNNSEFQPDSKFSIDGNKALEEKLSIQEADPLVTMKLINNGLQLSAEQSIAFIKTCIAMADASVKLAQEQQLVLFIGDAGAGKSTVINYLHGCIMIKESGRVIVNPTSTQAEIVAIGHDSHSKALIPQVRFSKNTGLIFCDCPGFADSRGPEINISNSVNLKRILRAADSVKIVILITYDSIFNTRGKAVAELKKTLSSLFGDTANLQTLSKSILIGITKAPISVDNNFVNIQFVRETLFEVCELPIELKTQTHIIDPLDRRQANYSLTREEWLANINQLIPIKKLSQSFNTALNTTDKILLLTISSNLSDKIEANLRSGEFKVAAHYLSLLASLRIIDHPEIEEHLKKNLLNLASYIAVKEQQIVEMADQDDSNHAEEKLNEMRTLVGAFQADFPEATLQTANIHKYLYHKKLESYLDEIYKLLDTLTKQYYQASYDNILLSNAIIQSSHLSQSSQENPLDFIYIVLAEFKKIPKINEPALKLLFKIRDFTEKYSDYENIALFIDAIQYCSKELKNIISNAEQNHQDFLYKKISLLKSYIYESIHFIREKIADSTHTKDFLLKLDNLTDDATYVELQEFLAQLSHEKTILTYVKLLALSLSHLDKIGKERNDWVSINSQVKFVCIRLLDLKNKLQTAQKEQEQKELIEQEKQADHQRKLHEENAKLRLQENKLYELETLLKKQQDEMAEETEREKQTQLRIEELQRKYAEMTQKGMETDKILQQQSLAKILSKTQEKLRSITCENTEKRRLARWHKLGQKRNEIIKKQQELKELHLKLGANKYAWLNSQEPPDLQSFYQEETFSNIPSKPKLSDAEVEEIAKKEMAEERAVYSNKRKLARDKIAKELQDGLLAIETSKKDSLLAYGEIIKLYQALENYALQLRNAPFYSSRGNFYYELAAKQNKPEFKESFYRNALRDYKRALTYDSSLENISKNIKEIEYLLRSEFYKGSDSKQRFFPGSQINSKKDSIKREDLTPEELEKFKLIKDELRKLAGTNLKL